MQAQTNRRVFLGRTAAKGLGLILLNDSRSARGYAANEELQIALVGVGGRGAYFVREIPKIGRIAAMCDVNQERAAPGFKQYPDIPKYDDFRLMIDKMAPRLDGVVVSTPDHTHAVASAYALRAGLHAFCEKGLSRTVHEARALAELTVETQLSTQMGNQAGYNTRLVEHIGAGKLGDIQTIHMWGGAGAGPRKPPSNAHDVPDHLNWDLWLGPAVYRPYHPDWLRHGMWRDFSSGHPGWWGAHLWATLFKAMKLDALWPVDKKAPLAGRKTIRVTAEVSEVSEATYPRGCIVYWDIPARMDMPAIRLNWYAGGKGRECFDGVVNELFKKHPRWGSADDERWKSWVGNLWVGTEGVVYTYGHGCHTVDVLPEEKFKDVPLSHPVLSGLPDIAPLPEDMFKEVDPPSKAQPGRFLRGWAQGMRDGLPTMSCFNRFSGPFAEWYLLANVATQFPGETLEFDPVDCRIVNHDRADQEIGPPYREGWTL